MLIITSTMKNKWKTNIRIKTFDINVSPINIVYEKPNDINVWETKTTRGKLECLKVKMVQYIWNSSISANGNPVDFISVTMNSFANLFLNHNVIKSAIIAKIHCLLTFLFYIRPKLLFFFNKLFELDQFCYSRFLCYNGYSLLQDYKRRK